MKRPESHFSVSLLVAAIASASPAIGDTVGIVADNGSKSIVVFDADSGEVAGSIAIPGTLVGDCVIAPERKLAFVTDFDYGVWVIDLSDETPVLAGGTNPIPISNVGEDLALSADERFLLVTGGLSIEPIAAIDLDLMAEVFTLPTPSNNISVDVTDTGSVLATSLGGRRVTRYDLDPFGRLSNTGHGFAISNPNNVYGAPGGMSAVVVTRASRSITSFALPYVIAPQGRRISGQGLSGAFNAKGDVLYVRMCSPSMIEAFTFDPVLGSIGATPFLSFAVGDAPSLFGIEQMVLHPSENALYVPEPGAIRIYDAWTGSLLSTLSDPMIQSPLGIDMAVIERAAPNAPPMIATHGPLELWPPDRRMVDVSGTFSVEDPDGDPMTMSCRMLSNERQRMQPDFVDEMENGGGLLVRSQRKGAGDGRFYLLIVEADDGRGGVSQKAMVAAVVPHDQSRRSRNAIMNAALASEAEMQAILDAGSNAIPAHLSEVGGEMNTASRKRAARNRRRSR